MNRNGWTTITFIKLMNQLAFQQALENGAESITEFVPSATQKPYIDALQALFQNDLLRLAKWRDEALCGDNWQAMPCVWKRDS